MQFLDEKTINTSKVSVRSTICNDTDRCPILLVEDNPDDILITKRAWSKGLIKNKLYIVNNGEVLKTVKQDAKLKRLPIIVLTTSNRDKDIQRAFNLGCNSYILKPVDYEKFLEAVETIQKYWMTICEIPLL